MKYGHYSVNEESNSSISKILAEIEPNSKVIEFGSSSGYILEYLKEKKKCEVHGYEIDKEAVSSACERRIKTTLLDLDRVDETFFTGLAHDIDYIICADILEHLKSMKSFIQLLALYMKSNSNCMLLVSVPNITYYGVVDDLLHGVFKYRELGILDNTHLRFYDKVSLAAIFNSNNLEILSLESIRVSPEESEFNLELNQQIVDILDSYGNSDYLTYQYVFKVKYSDNVNKFLIENNKGRSPVEKLRSVQGRIIKELNDIVDRKDSQIIELNDIVDRKDSQIIELNSLASALRTDILTAKKYDNKQDGKIARLISERDTVVRDFVAIRQSTSWRLTAPLRFIGHLIKGNFGIARSMVRKALHRGIWLLPKLLRDFFRRPYEWLLKTTKELPTSKSNNHAMLEIVEKRCAGTRETLIKDPLCPLPKQQTWAAIDISIVTYNSSRWIADFVESLLELDYPKELLTVCFVDNSSTDSTVVDLRAVASKLRVAGLTVEVIERPNHGFGSGHNTAIEAGNSPLCLVTNIDITFEPDALSRVVAIAQADSDAVAAWELCQKPYEHPKFYDPVTGLTNWNSHACVLLRRSAYEKVGGYDKSLFMYGEDVELSYRLRRAGFLLRYCPQAAVWHYTYESAHQVKPLQYIGSTYANLYIRLKYGKLNDMLAVPILGVRLIRSPEPYPGSRRTILRSLLKLFVMSPKILLSRRPTKGYFSFRTFDYELSREGAFVEQQKLPESPPLVSVVTRTYCGRELFLRQALLSVAHQTYPNIEHIVVEDGGETMRTLVDNVSQKTGKCIQFIKLDKLGRSAAGNAGLSAAKGRWCVFLDDDDLLFADHVETLVNTLLAQPDVVGAYSLAWEVKTDNVQLIEGTYSEISHEVLAILRQEFDPEVLKKRNYIAIQSLLFERRLFEERGGFEVDMDALEDWCLWKKYADGNRFYYVPKVTSMFRTPADPEEYSHRQQVLNEAYKFAVGK